MDSAGHFANALALWRRCAPSHPPATDQRTHKAGIPVLLHECPGKHGSGSARCGSGASGFDPRQSGPVGVIARID